MTIAQALVASSLLIAVGCQLGFAQGNIPALEPSVLQPFEGGLREHPLFRKADTSGRARRFLVGSGVKIVSPLQGDRIAIYDDRKITLLKIVQNKWVPVASWPVTTNVIILRVSPDLTKVAYGQVREVDMRVMPSMIGDVAVVEIASKKARIVARNAELTHGIAWMPAGAGLLVPIYTTSKSTPEEGRPLRLVRFETKKWKPVGSFDGSLPMLSLDSLGSYFVSERGQTKYLNALSNDGQQRQILKLDDLPGVLEGVVNQDRFIVWDFVAVKAKRGADPRYREVTRTGKVLRGSILPFQLIGRKTLSVSFPASPRENRR
jgi:hypothetical protein